MLHPDATVPDEVSWLTAALGAVGGGVVRLDPGGAVASMDAIAASLTGWAPEEAVGRELAEVVRVADGPGPEKVLTARDGRTRDVVCFRAAIPDGAGVLVLRAADADPDVIARAERDHALDILDTQREPFLVLDSALRVVSANRAFYETFRMLPAQTEGQPLIELGDRAWDIPRLRELLGALLAGTDQESAEVEHDFRGVGHRALQLTARRIRTRGSLATLLLLAISDVTERRHADRARSWLAAIVESSDDAIVSKGLDTIITTWNRGAEALFGYTAEEAIGRSVTMLIPEDLLGEEPAILARVREGLPVPAYETVRRRKDGSLVHVSLRVSPLFDADRRVVGASKIVRDITDRIQAEQALREGEARFRMLAENMSQLAWICDATLGNVTWYNQRWLDYTGRSLEEMAGFGWSVVQHPDHLDRVVAGAERAQASGEPWEDSFPLAAADGTYRWFLSRAMPIRDAQGAITHWFGTNTDVTEQRELERRIVEQAEQLAGESRRKDEFLAMLSHELRNPLAPIRSAVHLLRLRERPGDEDPIARQAREVIERQVANLTSLVSDLLEVSRVVSGRVRLELEPVDLSEIVRQAVDTSRPLVEGRKHTLALHACDGGPWVVADARRMEQVFVNLLTNAAKYTPEGGAIDVHCELLEELGAAEVRVRDDGVGIDGALLPRVFDLFTQAERSLARSEGGLGIGLALAHRLVDMHGGTIRVQSPPPGRARGTEFAVRIPLAGAPRSLPPLAAPMEALSASGARILLVDDNLDLVLVMAAALRHAGYSVQTASDGPTGLRTAREWRPDVILLDIGLPGLDGYEVARRIRADHQPEVQRARLIALTGYGRADDKRDARLAGFDAHLIKPVDVDALLRMLAGLRGAHPPAEG